MSARVLSLVQARKRQPSPIEVARIEARELAESVVSLIDMWVPLDMIEEEIGRVVVALRKSEGLL